MYSKKLSFLHLLILLLILRKSQLSSSSSTNFIFNSFKSSKLTLDGVAQITPNGLLKLTNYTFPSQGHAFYPDPIPFKPSSSYSSNGLAVSFSTSFIFAIQSEAPQASSHGIVFVVTPKPSLSGSRAANYLGLFNESNDGKSSNHVFGVELDTIQTDEFHDINSNHVGIDINSLVSIVSAPASYVPFPSSSSSSYKNLTLFSGKPMRVWIEYNGTEMKTTVTIAPINLQKPKIPLLTLHRDLSPVLNNNMYVGFSGATGSLNAYHCILAWSFALNGSAAEIDISKLPKLPRTTPKKISKMITTGVPVIAVAVMAAIVCGTVNIIYRQRKFAEEVDDWESDYGPHRFKYKDLYLATKGFKDNGLLGTGGFGRVYRGVLPKTKTEIAVKKISHESRQGMREFIAEIVSLGRLRHRNLVQLLGYCRRKGELELVYDYMPNGSLDRYLHSSNNNGVNILNLTWKQRFKIIKGVASGLLYLHEEWEQVVVHRDIKASNVLLDADLNGRLGDFGLARLYDHGSDPQTTHVVGTLGYLAPEFTWKGKATRSTDVFAFGAFLLEVACGRRPINVKVEDEEECVLCEWVFGKWKKGELLLVVDPRLEGEFDDEEAVTVLKLGLMCSSVDPGMRPTMREVIGYLEGVVKLPDMESGGVPFGGNSWRVGGVTVGKEGFSDHVMSSHNPSSSMATTSTQSSSITDSLLNSF